MPARRSLIALATLVFVGLAGGILAGNTLLAPNSPPAADTFLAIGSVSNLLPPLAVSGVAVFQPTSGTLEPLLDTSQPPAVSPDDRDLFFRRSSVVGHELRTSIVAIDADTLHERWRVGVAAEPLPPAGQTSANDLNVALAPARDRLYVTLHHGTPRDQITVLALDRVDGFERGRWRSTSAIVGWMSSRPSSRPIVGTWI
jgi:hypothetical protein